MAQDNAQSSNTTWSWADMVSSYRFWGLCFFYIFTFVATGIIINSNIFNLFREYHGIESTMSGTIMGARNIAFLFGFYIGWLIVRSRIHYLLLVFAAVELLCMAAFSFSSNYIILYTASIFLGMSEGALIIAVTALIAGGRGGALPQ